MFIAISTICLPSYRIPNNGQEPPIPAQSANNGTRRPPGAPEQDPRSGGSLPCGDLQKATDVLDSLDHKYGSQDLQLSLHHAVHGGHLQLARYLFERGGTADGMVAYCAIHTGAERDLVQVFELMLEHGWDVNEGLHYSYTALCCKPVLKNHAAVQWLLDHGANPNMGPSVTFQLGGQVVPDSGSALQFAAFHSDISTLDLLLEHGAKQENSFPLHAAAAKGSGRIPMMAHLIGLWVDVNGLDTARVRFRHGTPLHCAVDGRHLQTVRFLLENGADPHVEDVSGVTPIEMAKKKGDQDIVALLEKVPARGNKIRAEE